MGVKQSKRSVDITEISTKGEIEGFGNEGKVEKIVEGVAEKVAANGHVDGDLLNGGESQQNGIEPMQNKEAVAVAAEKALEVKVSDESAAGVVNGSVENGEINGEAEKIDEESKKSEDKKEKKKDKKEKAVKKKFSFRNFSFSKKDKSKPPKEEKTPERMVEAETEEVLTSPVVEQNATENLTVDINQPEEPAQSAQISSSVEIEAEKVVEEPNQGMEQISAENIDENIPKTTVSSEDLPPPLPASPPPSEIAATAQDSSPVTVEHTLSSVNEVECTVTNILREKIETAEEVMKSAEQRAIETGKQIEEKATNLLKTVEERAGESMKTVEEFISQKTEEIVEACQNSIIVEQNIPNLVQQESQVNEPAEKVAENITTAPVEISNLDSLATNAEDSLEKREEGAGESLADIPQDLKDVTEATVEPAETDSLEISAVPPPPPVVEPVTGE